MADSFLPKPDSQVFNQFIRSQAAALRAKDTPPTTRKEWENRRMQLRQAMFAAMGPFPDKPCELEPKVVGVLQRQGYRIEKLIFQSRPDVWVTANAYVPEPVAGRVPAVLVVHGHWPWARRDPVVQARCLGLVKLGIFVLAVDAFGAGERFTEPGKGTYHGGLYGSTLWPVGQTLLGMQVYDNRRAVDYLRSRAEVDGDRFGITGASGGGNQTMYAGALDERFRAVVPVCSVGNYQAYLQAACCVCEVLPGALRFAEEGDVLSLAAPRALLVINATQDAHQFSVGEAKKSMARAQNVFQLLGVSDHLRHEIFESPHAYNQPMREAMYGWMLQWLKHEGKGRPVAEPKHEVEQIEDLSCFPDGQRPKGFLFPPTLAAREARALLRPFTNPAPDHREDWESRAVHMRILLGKNVVGEFAKPSRPAAQGTQHQTEEGIHSTSFNLYPESGMPVPVVMKKKGQGPVKPAVCLLLHLAGNKEALKHPLASALIAAGVVVVAPDLRATGETRPAENPGRLPMDHNSAEHALWIGRPLLGQWVVDISHLSDWLALQPGLEPRRVAVAGIGPAGIVALVSAGYLENQICSAAAIGTPATFITEAAYGPKMRMGLLAPGILRTGDNPHLAALVAPRPLVIADSISPIDRSLKDKEIQEAYAYTKRIYRLYKGNRHCQIGEDFRMEAVVAGLFPKE